MSFQRKGMRARFALRFGDENSDGEKGVTRASQVREAFNSPFWPFVRIPAKSSIDSGPNRPPIPI